MHAQLDAFRRALGDAQQLDAVAELFGVLDVDRIQFRDAFDVGLVELHRDAECQRGQNRDLVRGIHALDVEGRVGLGVAQALRLFQHGVEAQALVAHLGQDEVGGAVDDAGDPLDAVRGQAFAQRLDDRDAARHRRLERDHHALVLRGLEYLVAVRREQRLVRGDHMLAVGDRLHHQFLRDAVAADQLDDDIHFRIAHHRECIVGHAALAAGDFLRQLQILVRHDGDADRAPGAARDLFGVALQHGEGAAADRADTEEAYVDWFNAHICVSVFVRFAEPI